MKLNMRIKEMRKKILLINCGGTISMHKENNVYVPKKGNLLRTIKGYSNIFEELGNNSFTIKESNIFFDVIEMDPLIDSANLCPEDWIKMVEVIEKADDYHGYVILHGTDTLAYTASALSFMIQNLNKPIILTGSQIPLMETRSDGLTNMTGSLIISSKYELNMVCVFFENKLFQGNRVKKISSLSTNAFNSPNFPLLGKIELKPELFYKKNVETKKAPYFHKKVSSGIKIIKIFPGFDSKMLISFNKLNTKAIILETFGSGNAPTTKDFISAIDYLILEGILIINVTQCIEGAVCNDYETGNELVRSGVLSGRNITTEAAFAKLHYLFSKYDNVGIIRTKFLIELVNEMESD